jgi:RNA polymerase primary sigma factor
MKDRDMSSAEVIESDESAQPDLDEELKNEAISDSVRLYLNQIGKTALLDAVEEVELAQRIEAGQFAKTIKEVRNPEAREETLESTKKVMTGSKYPGANVEQELGRLTRLADNKRALPDKWLNALEKDGDKAKEHMLEANLRLVVSLAKRYTGRGMPLLDLINEGNLGLIRAVEKFDYTKGFKFSTYATWWIRQGITRAMADQGRTIRVPVHLVEQFNKLGRLERDLLQDLGREATDEELAKEMSMPVKKLKDLKHYRREPISLDMPVGDSDNNTLSGILADADEMTSVEDATLHTDMVDALNQSLTSIDSRLAHILQLRYGLIDGQPKTFDEIGKMLGLSRERIRQLETKAFNEIRKPGRTQGLASHVDGGEGRAQPKKASGRNTPTK